MAVISDPVSAFMYRYRYQVIIVSLFLIFTVAVASSIFVNLIIDTQFAQGIIQSIRLVNGAEHSRAQHQQQQQNTFQTTKNAQLISKHMLESSGAFSFY